VTPDGSRILTGSYDRGARIWDAASGRELARLTGHEGWVTSVAVTPDGTRIVTGSWDNTARIWDLFPSGQALIDDAKNVVPGCLTSAERERYYLPPESPRWCYDMAKYPYDAKTLNAKKNPEEQQ
jgi:WD40 repeat protein